MKPIDGYFLIQPKDLAARLSNLMKTSNADFLERSGSENLGAPLAAASAQCPYVAPAYPGASWLAPIKPIGNP